MSTGQMVGRFSLNVAGASMVEATGGTYSRSLSDHFGDILNVKDFGAVGDGLTDDTTAIQAAIDAAQVSPRGGVVFLPRGTYAHSELTVANPGHLTIRGDHQTWFDGGTRLHYTGTGNAISVNAGSGLPAYRIRFQDFGLTFSAATATSGIYLENISECIFDNIGVNGNWSTQTVDNGFDINGAGICYFSNCIVQMVTTAFNVRGYQTSQASGISINKCNIFWTDVPIRSGFANYLHVYDSWIEAFKTGILIDTDYYYGPQTHLDVAGCYWQQSWGASTVTVPWASSANARILSITSTDNSKPIRVRGSFTKNTAYMTNALTNAGPATYANSIVISGNVSTRDIVLSFAGNRWLGIATAGVYADTTDPVLMVSGNEVSTDFWAGTPLPEVSGANLVNRLSVQAEQIFTAQTAGKVPVVVQGVTAQTANLQEWKNAGGTAVASVDPAGTLNGSAVAVTSAYAGTYQAPGGSSAIVFGNAADGGAAVGVYVGPQSAFSTDGAKLLSIRSAASERAYFNALGGLSLGAPTAAWTLNAIYSGSGAPNNSYGSNGDFYFRTDTPGTGNQRLYVKAAGVWTGIV